MPKKKASELKRARNGAGSVQFLDNGKVRILFMMPANPVTGKPPYRTSIDGDTAEAARLAMSKRITAVSENTYQKPSYMTFGTWLDIYQNEFMDGIKESTRIAYEGIINRYLKPCFGKYRLFELNPSLIKSEYNKLRKGTGKKSGISPKTIRNVNGLMHNILEKAVEPYRHIQRNPVLGISLPRVEKREATVIERDNVDRFLAAIRGHKYEALYFFDLFCGLRQGEALGLTWKDVDFKDGLITVRHQLQREKKKDGIYRLVSLKNDDKSRRTIKPPRAVLDMLRHVKATQAQWRLTLGSEYNNPMNLVFTHENGQHLPANTVYVPFKKIVRGLGLGDVRFHDLRTSAGLYARENGASLKEIQLMLGHSVLSTTMDIYGTKSEYLESRTAENLDAFIRSRMA
ncbi:MAG: site-specific integrase [Clostridia bacterium]|nr:site-specific integrase [Clostridia bacterium]